MLNLESRPGGWIKYQDVVRLMYKIEKEFPAGMERSQSPNL